ncbi:MAG TPA: acyltransferase family protein, partial [Acidimicrobiales bacterium]|nr:acyltransferase family protein [Acidimicrobiales bacterium]
GGLLLASLMSAVVVACLPGPPTSLTRVLELRPLAWIGERSYGIYLWHWPILLLVVASRPAVSPGSPPDSTTVVLTVGLTLALATASYAWLEMPVRRRGVAGLQHIGRAGGVAAAAVAVAAALIVVTAPDKTAAQLAVEAGLAAIDEQSADAGGAEAAPPGEPAWPPERRLPPGDHIAAFGDSVLSGAAPAIYERFPGIFIDAEPIRQWRDAPAVIEAAGAVRPVVVLQFGTNAGLETEESQEALSRVLDQLGPERRVVLVNVVGVSHWVDASNERLAEIAADHPNVAVADWHEVVEQNPALLHDDLTHPTTEGTVAYSNLLAATMRRLGPGP